SRSSRGESDAGGTTRSPARRRICARRAATASSTRSPSCPCCSRPLPSAFTAMIFSSNTRSLIHWYEPSTTGEQCRHAARTFVCRWAGFVLNCCVRSTPLGCDIDVGQRSSAATKGIAMGEEQAPQAFKLSDRQHRIMSFIRMGRYEQGYTPTMREIGEAVGRSSPSSVKYQLKVHEEKGLLRRDPISTRAIEIIGEEYATTTMRGVVVPTQDGAAS